MYLPDYPKPIRILFLLLCAFTARPIAAQQASEIGSGSASKSPPSSSEADSHLDLEALLSDPTESDDAFRSLKDVRHRLASGGKDLRAFVEAAEELAALEAYTPAIEILWFATKMNADSETAKTLQKRMQVWAAAARSADRAIEEGEQLYAAGRHREALESFLEVTKDRPFSERAHFRLADTWARIYAMEYGEDESLPPLPIRVGVFRDAYVHYTLAREIDPLFYDAYYGLSELRGLIPDHQEFLITTQPMTQRALDFRGEVLGVLSAIEEGREDGPMMFRLGQAFETIGIYDFAVYAYQAALAISGSHEEASLRLNTLRRERFGEGDSD